MFVSLKYHMYGGPELSVFVMSWSLCLLRGHAEISLPYGIPQIGHNRLTNWTESYLVILSFSQSQQSLLIFATLVLKAISKMVAFYRKYCFWEPILITALTAQCCCQLVSSRQPAGSFSVHCFIKSNVKKIRSKHMKF